jgi:hypothetical protein
MRIFFTGYILLAISCNQITSDKPPLQYINGRQLLNLNGLTIDGETLEIPGIDRVSPDSVFAGEQFIAKLFIADSAYELIDAYFGCEAIENPTVDTAIEASNKHRRLDGCRKGLFVQNDTIFISFTPIVSGKKTFEQITVLTRDRCKIFRTQIYTFDYYVIEK